jgi:hypothetical protein
MSEPTGPAPTSRSSVVAIVLGLVLVAAVIAGALVIERATDSDLDLPDTVGGDMRAEPRNDLARSAESRLEDVMDASATIRSYRASDERGGIVMVVDQAAGPFLPRGPNPAPALMDLARGPFELVNEGDAVCQVTWANVVAEGEDVPDEDPAGVQCQLGAHGRTYLLYGTGMSTDEAVDILEKIAD